MEKTIKISVQCRLQNFKQNIFWAEGGGRKLEPKNETVISSKPDVFSVYLHPRAPSKGAFAFSLFLWISSLIFNKVLLNSFKTKQKAYTPVDVKSLFLLAMSRDILALGAEWPVGEEDGKKAK